MSTPGPAGHPAQWPEHIRARYGVSDRPRWAPAALVALGVAFLAVVTILGWRLANPAIDAGVTEYLTLAEDHMRIEYVVTRRDESPATCVLRARAEDGFDVGYIVEELPAAQGPSSHTVELRTAYRAIVGELVGCGLSGPPPGLPGAQFRPGVTPPQQPWTPDGA